MSRTILFVGSNYRPEPIGIGPYTAGLAEGLAERGHRVAVVTGQPHYPQWQVWDGYGSPRRETLRGVEVSRVAHYVPVRPGGAKRIAHYASFAARAYRPALQEAQRIAPDCIVAVAPSIMNIPVAGRAAKATGAHLWVHIQDFEVEAALATGLLPRAAVASGLGFEARALRRADTVSTISPQMCAKAADKIAGAGRIVELRNWANHIRTIEGSDGNRMRATLGVGERMLVLYSGNIARKQGLEIVVEAARRLQRHEDIAFLVLGPAEGRAALEEAARGLVNIRFGDLVPPERIGEVLKAADVHVLPQLAGAADLVLPSKLANMLASGRPVVATAAAGTGLASEVEGCGFATPAGDPGALADALVRLKDDGLRTALGKAAAERARTRWTLEAALDTFEARLEQVA